MKKIVLAILALAFCSFTFKSDTPHHDLTIYGFEYITTFSWGGPKGQPARHNGIGKATAAQVRRVEPLFKDAVNVEATPGLIFPDQPVSGYVTGFSDTGQIFFYVSAAVPGTGKYELWRATWYD